MGTLRRFLAPLLVVVAVALFTIVAACGDDGEDGSTSTPQASETPSDGRTPEATATPQGSDGNGDGAADEAFGDVPVPSGASETESGNFNGSIPGFVPGAGGLDQEGFSSLQFKSYELDDSPADILDFYRERMDDWDEAFTFGGGVDGEEGSLGLWTREDGDIALWVVASRDNGTTELVVVLGSTE